MTTPASKPPSLAISLLIATLQDHHLVPTPHPLGELPLAARGTAELKSASLCLVAGENTALVILQDSAAGKPLAAAQFHSTRGQDMFKIACRLDASGQTVPRAEGGYLTPLQADSVQVPQSPVELRKQNGLIDIAFLFDGTMAEPDLELARQFVRHTGSALRQKDVAVRLACVIYGEYQNYPAPPDRKRKFDFAVVPGAFQGYDEFDSFAASRIRYAPCFREKDKEQDICDALELGLQKVRQLEWKARAQHLILVGNSPPHPTRQERQARRLLDWTADEFDAGGGQGINWAAEVEGLRESRRMRFHSYWVKPSEPPFPEENQLEYGADVWNSLSDGGQTHVLEQPHANVAEIEADELAAAIAKTVPVELVPETPVNLPLLCKEAGRLYGAMSAE